MSTTSPTPFDGDYSSIDIQKKEKELRRARGEISCVECRRLKIRCDRKVPCSSCVRRHCEDLCPNGFFSGADVDPKQLLSELARARNRMRQLEEALRISHLKQSSQPHPLLQEILTSPSSSSSAASLKPLTNSEHDILELLGTLTIAEGGESRFLGLSAASESFLLSEEDRSNDKSDAHIIITPSLAQLGHMWPFAPVNHPKEDLLSLIESQLPSYERASSLCEAYLHNLSWFLGPISRTQVMNELLPVIYRRRENSNSVSVNVHDLALILALFACGAAGDFTQEPDNKEGQIYGQLCRAALGLGSILEKSSLSSIQAIMLLGLYNLYSAREQNQEESWKILSFAMSSATSLGLRELLETIDDDSTYSEADRDPARWHLPEKLQERRRALFWEAFALDCSRALSCGRPPTFPVKSIDVKYPQDAKLTQDAEDDARDRNDKYWRYEFMRRCQAPVADRICADAAPVKYKEVLEFDRLLREYENERAEKVRPVESDPFSDPLRVVKQQLINIYCEALRVGIHRNFFARAITDHPENPLMSPFAVSFQTAFRGAMTILKLLHSHLELSVLLARRVWPYWSQTLSAVVVIGMVAIRCTTSSLAQPAYASLDLAIQCFTKGGNHPVVVKGMPILLRMKEKAQRAILQSQTPFGTLRNVQNVDPGAEEEDVELAILQGASRVVSQNSEPATKTPPSGERQVDAGIFDFATMPSNRSADCPILDIPASGPSGIQTCLPGDVLTDDWITDIDMLTSGELGLSVSSPDGTATGDGAFVNLGLDALLAPALGMQADVGSAGYADVAFDVWFAGGDPSITGTTGIDQTIGLSEEFIFDP